MSIIRSSLRTQHMKQEDNYLSDRPDVYAGHELDWLALYMDLRDEADGSNKGKRSKKSGGSDSENRNVLYWGIPSLAAVVKCPPSPKPPKSPSPKDTTLPEDPKPDVPTDMAKGFDAKS